jgi:hypothetical protein
MIKYVRGDATRPTEEGNKAIIHIVNDVPGGRWGRGFVLAINKTFGTDCKDWYLQWASGRITDVKFSLGKIQVVRVADNISVINMVAQHGIGLDRNGRAPIRYEELGTCLDKVANYIKKQEGSWTVVGPKLGSGLAGGKWEIIEKLIEERICSQGIPVIIYTP